MEHLCRSYTSDTSVAELADAADWGGRSAVSRNGKSVAATPAADRYRSVAP